MIARCERSDLPVDACACEGCAPDAEVVTLDDPTPHTLHRGDGHAVPVEVPAPLDYGTRPLSRALQQAVDLHDTLGGLLGGHRTGPDSEGGKSANDGPPLPLREQVAEHRHQLVHDLRWWVGHVSAHLNTGSTVTLTGDGSERVVTRVPELSSDPQRLAAFLNGAAWLHTHDSAEALVDVLRAWVRRAHVLSDLPKLRARLPLRMCYTVELTDCTGVVYALIPADRDELVVVECADCRSRWDVAQLPEASEFWVGQTDAARLVGMRPSTLYSWARRGQLDVDDGGRVQLVDVLSRFSGENLSDAAHCARNA